jgi:hypothetical protein
MTNKVHNGHVVMVAIVAVVVGTVSVLGEYSNVAHVRKEIRKPRQGAGRLLMPQSKSFEEGMISIRIGKAVCK